MSGYTAVLERRLTLKRKFRNRAAVFGAWTSLYHSSIAEIFAGSGVDFIGIDLEHSSIDLDQSRQIIATSQGSSVCCLPRIPSHNMELIKRLLDAGADGIIVPMVSSLGEIRQIAEWCQYPPCGRRSFGIARGQGYGFNFGDYVRNWNDSACLIAQIESTEGVSNIEEILSHEAVDGAMIGPYDLSGSLGVPGELDHPELIRSQTRVIEACKRAGRGCGTQVIEPNDQSVRDALNNGFSFAVLASDIFILWKWAERTREVIRRLKRP